jgi:hypothetical protein
MSERSRGEVAVRPEATLALEVDPADQHRVGR